MDEKIGKPVLLGDPAEIARVAEDIEIALDGIPVVDPRTVATRASGYAQAPVAQAAAQGPDRSPPRGGWSSTRTTSPR